MIKITSTKLKRSSPVTILHLEGALDGANYESLIIAAQNEYDDGVRDLILDLGKLAYISSAGLGAIHQVALMFGGRKRNGSDKKWDDYRWDAYRRTNRDKNAGLVEHVRLLSPNKEVLNILDMIGFTSLFAIYSDLSQAKASIHRPVSAREASPR